MNQQELRNKRVVVGIIAAFIVFVIISVILFIIDQRKTATLELLVAPSFAKVEINGRTFPTDGSYRFEPGTATIIITADNFTSKELTLELKANETAELYTYLVPSDGNMDWYAEHPDEDMVLTSIGNHNTALASANYAKKYPVSTVLPIVIVDVDRTTYEWTEYRIDGGQFDGCDSDFCIKITDTTGGNRENALNQIRAKGFNPNDYQILYEYTPIEPLPAN